MALLLLIFAVISASLHSVGTGLPIKQDLHGEVMPEVEEVAKRQALAGLNQYLLAVFMNWGTYRKQQCNSTYNDQPVNPHICKATVAKGIPVLDSDEYDDCSGKYKVDLSTTVTAMELALYKQAGWDSNQYYVIVKYGAKIATLYVPGSAGPGWQVVPLQGAVSEVVGGALDILVTVYTSASGFLSCTQVKSMFTVTSPGNTSPVLSVYTNASGSGGGLTYDVQSAGLNHSYVAMMNGTKSECATKATAMMCYSNVSLSFKTSDKADSLELDFTVTLATEQLKGSELALYLNTNTFNTTYTVYVYRRVTPVQFTPITNRVIPPNTSGWQTFSLDALTGKLKANSQVNVSLLIQVVRTDANNRQTSLTSPEVHSLLDLNPNTDYSPILMAYVHNTNPCSYLLLCKRDAAIEDVGEEEEEEEEETGNMATHSDGVMTGGRGGGGGGGGGGPCQVQDHQLNLRTLYPDVVYPHTANVGRCTSPRHTPATDSGGSLHSLGGGGGGGGGKECARTQYSSLYSLHKVGLSYQVLEHAELIVTECGYI